jgi:hypothetical protein
LQLVRLERMLADRKLTIEITDEAKAFVAREGYDPAYGARPLKRALQRLVQDPLALSVLEGEFTEGDLTLTSLNFIATGCSISKSIQNKKGTLCCPHIFIASLKFSIDMMVAIARGYSCTYESVGILSMLDLISHNQ